MEQQWMASKKDHEDVIQFRRAFQRLRDMIDNDPSTLEDLAANDDSVKKQCVALDWTATVLRIAEERDRQKFAAPTDPKFIEDWRDYEDRYAAAIAGVMLSDLGVDLFQFERKPDQFKRLVENAAFEASRRAEAIEGALEFADEQADQEWRDFPEGFAESIKDGIAEWRRLAVQTGFNLENVFRRRELVPFTLVPKHVSDRHGSAEKLTLLTHLQQAHEAFIFGTPFAALALMRSILEVVLKMHYMSTGKGLEQIINNARFLPRSIEKRNLHSLRELANDILHFERNRVQLPEDLERQIILHLYTLRTLIEGAPPTSQI